MAGTRRAPGRAKRTPKRAAAAEPAEQPRSRRRRPRPHLPHLSRTNWISAAIALVLIAAGAAVVLARSGNHSSGPRPLTSAEATLLAGFRYLNYQHGGTAFTATTGAAGETLNGYVDFTDQLGYAVLSSAGQQAVLQWDTANVEIWLGGSNSSEPPAQLPAGNGTSRALNPALSSVDTLLKVLLAVSASAPDDPAQLKASGSRFVRRDKIGSDTVDVINGPSTAASGLSAAANYLQYWVGLNGQLLRLDLSLDASQAPAVISFEPNGYQMFQRSPTLDNV